MPDDQVLHHARRPRRLLDRGRRAAAAVRLGLDHPPDVGSWSCSRSASFIERLAERFTVIRYDKPGCGLSDRDGIDLSFDGQVAAALAVADAAGADRFSLFGASQGGQLAAAIAARYPERVEALVLYGTCANGADLAPAEVRESVVALVRAHWGLGSKVLTGVFVTDPSAEEVAAFARFQRASASAAMAAALLEVYYDTDVRALLPSIRARTAVLHRAADQGTRFELGREVAALIPGATLVPLPGSSHLFYHGDWGRSWRRCSASWASRRAAGRSSPAASWRWPG